MQHSPSTGSTKRAQADPPKGELPTLQRPRRILFVMSNTGGGHRAAAQAIAYCVRGIDPRAEVEIVDVINDVSPFWSSVVRLYGPLVRSAPWLWGVLFNVFGGRASAPLWQATQRALMLTLRDRLVPYIDAKQPDVVCSTHPLVNQGTELARTLYRQVRGRQLPFAVVITDPVTFHPAWIEAAADLTVVGTAQAAERALACGASPDRLRVLGVPIHPEFFSPARGAREALNLDENAPVVLVAGGGEGMGGLARIVEALLQVNQAPVVLAVAGRDEALQGWLEARTLRDGGERLRAFGFTDRMSTLMAAADVIVTKAGPGTMFEAMALGKPLVIADALPGQEAGNVELVRRERVGLVALGGPGDVVRAVATLLGDEAMRDAARRRALALSRPDAAESIAHALLAMCPPRGPS